MISIFGRHYTLNINNNNHYHLHVRSITIFSQLTPGKVLNLKMSISVISLGRNI